MKIKIFSIAFLLFVLLSMLSYAALDLKFTSAIGISPASPKIGDTVTFSVTFKAEGGAASDVKVIGHVDGTLIYDRVFGSIPANATRTGSFTWTATAGSHDVSFTLDPSHTAGDSNYNNNTVSKAFSVSETGGILNTHDALTKKPLDLNILKKVKPDLIPYQIAVGPINENKCDQYWTLLLVVKNIGKTAIKQSFRNEVHADVTNEEFFCDIPSLEPGVEYQCHWTFTWNPEVGHMTFIGYVDITNAIDESVETNNKFQVYDYCHK